MKVDGPKIKTLLTQIGSTQKELSNHCKINTATVSKLIKSGHTSEFNARLIANFLEVNLNEIAAFENGDPIPVPLDNVVYIKDPECEKQVLELMDKVKDLKKIIELQEQLIKANSAQS
jgi:transcriptional regulator with XRE-family HTH domain